MKLLPNGIAVLDSDTHISKWVEQEGRLDHDQNTLPVILPYIQNDSWVVDAGAFIGDHTRAYLDKAKKGVVIAFEPNPESYECLLNNCPDAVCINAGLGKEFSTMGMVIDQNKGASFLSGNGFGATVINLDFFHLPKLDFFKLDIEGMELFALQGAEHTLKRLKPLVVCEINKSALERQGVNAQMIFSYMEKLGYRFKRVHESDMLDSPMFDIIFHP